MVFESIVLDSGNAVMIRVLAPGTILG